MTVTDFETIVSPPRLVSATRFSCLEDAFMSQANASSFYQKLGNRVIFSLIRNQVRLQCNNSLAISFSINKQKKPNTCIYLVFTLHEVKIHLSLNECFVE